MRLMLAACAAALLWPAAANATTPEEMAQRIAGALRESGELENYRVGVRYQDGVAWLLGTVTDADQAAAAARLAGEVDGVEHVVSKIGIGSASSAPAKAPAAKPSTQNKADVLLAMMEEQSAAPSPLPPNPSAMPALEAPEAAPARRKGSPRVARRGMPRPIRRSRQVDASVQAAQGYGAYGGGAPVPQGYTTGGAAGVSYDQANMPGYAWPSYAAYPNYSAVTYPKQYSPSAWPYIGPFYPYPQVPLGWRKVTLEWDDGWWFLDFSHQKGH